MTTDPPYDATQPHHAAPFTVTITYPVWVYDDAHALEWLHAFVAKTRDLSLPHGGGGHHAIGTPFEMTVHRGGAFPA